MPYNPDYIDSRLKDFVEFRDAIQDSMWKAHGVGLPATTIAILYSTFRTPV